MSEIFLNGECIGKVNGVLFDKDGTLSNSEERLLRLAKLRVEQAISLYGDKNVSNSQIYQLKELLIKTYGITSKGLSPSGTIAVASRNQNLISTATVLCLLGDSWPKAIETANNIFQSADELEKNSLLKSDYKTLLPGALQVFQNLKQAGVLCGLISNDTNQGIQSFLAINNLEHLLPYTWSADNSPQKPDPLAVKSLCEMMGLNPSECALIGDADSDMNMARHAGIELAIGYISGWSNPPELTAHQYLINHWNELSVD